jgi:hypothetical protein
VPRTENGNRRRQHPFRGHADMAVAFEHRPTHVTEQREISVQAQLRARTVNSWLGRKVFSTYASRSILPHVRFVTHHGHRFSRTSPYPGGERVHLTHPGPLHARKTRRYVNLQTKDLSAVHNRFSLLATMGR